jgi:hypothetical protein
MFEMKKALAVTLCLIISFTCFGFSFGIGDSTTRETLEGKETETPFILASKENLISFIKIERADGKKEYYLSCTEYTDGYYPITLRLSIDGNIETFFEKSPVYKRKV